jgi:hypothetical protein
MVNREYLNLPRMSLHELSKLSDNELIHYIEGDALILCALNTYSYSLDNDDSGFVIKFTLPKGTLSVDSDSLDYDDEALSLFDSIDLRNYRIDALSKLKLELKSINKDDKRL